MEEVVSCHDSRKGGIILNLPTNSRYHYLFLFPLLSLSLPLSFPFPSSRQQWFKFSERFYGEEYRAICVPNDRRRRSPEGTITKKAL